MQRKELGQTGVFVPEVGIGTWNYHAGPEPLRGGIEAGALFIDTAESYGSEPVVGEAVRGIRDRVFIATKVSPANFRSADFRTSVDASLLRLGVDELDLLQLHEPNADIPIEETMGAMESAVREGKVRFVGVSNFSVPELQEAQRALGKRRIVSNQVRYSLIDRTVETGLLQYCQANQISVIAYSPLGRELQRVFDCDPSGAIAEVARITRRSPVQVVLNWCLAKDGVFVIPKGNSTAHVIENCGASGWRLSAEQIALLDTRIQHRRRGRFDTAVRRYMPRPLVAAARRTISLLPRGLRRRIN